MKNNNLIGPSIWSWTDPHAFLRFIKSLVIRSSTAKNSREVPDVTIILKKGGKAIIRVKRDNKTITDAELYLLMQEHPNVNLFTMFTDRKIKIVNQEGVQINAKPPRAKKNVGSKKGSRKNSSVHEQLQSGPDSDVSQESPLCAQPEAKDQ